MAGLFTDLCQEAEQGVSSEQRVVGQMTSACEMASACEERAARGSVVDGTSHHSCDMYANVLLT